MEGFWPCFVWLPTPEQPLAALTAYISRDLITLPNFLSWLLYRTLNSLIPAIMHSRYSSHSSRLPLELVTFTPQHRDIRIALSLIALPSPSLSRGQPRANQ